MSDNIEVRDEIARMTGWKSRPLDDWASTDKLWMRDVETSFDHPIPNTLDEAAKLPEGWEYEVHNRQVGGIVSAAAIPPGGYWAARSEASGATEMEARFNLRLEVLKRIKSAALAAKETKQ